MAIWTTSCHYFATGEGSSMMAQITYADNKQQAIDKFSERFSHWYGQCADAEEGVVRNDVTKFVFSSQALDFCDKRNAQQDAGSLDLYASCHFNFS